MSAPRGGISWFDAELNALQPNIANIKRSDIGPAMRKKMEEVVLAGLDHIIQAAANGDATKEVEANPQWIIDNQAKIQELLTFVTSFATAQQKTELVDLLDREVKKLAASQMGGIAAAVMAPSADMDPINFPLKYAEFIYANREKIPDDIIYTSPIVDLLANPPPGIDPVKYAQMVYDWDHIPDKRPDGTPAGLHEYRIYVNAKPSLLLEACKQNQDLAFKLFNSKFRDKFTAEQFLTIVRSYPDLKVEHLLNFLKFPAFQEMRLEKNPLKYAEFVHEFRQKIPKEFIISSPIEKLLANPPVGMDPIKYAEMVYEWREASVPVEGQWIPDFKIVNNANVELLMTACKKDFELAIKIVTTLIGQKFTDAQLIDILRAHEKNPDQRRLELFQSELMRRVKDKTLVYKLPHQLPPSIVQPADKIVLRYISPQDGLQIRFLNDEMRDAFMAKVPNILDRGVPFIKISANEPAIYIPVQVARLRAPQTGSILMALFSQAQQQQAVEDLLGLLKNNCGKAMGFNINFGDVPVPGAVIKEFSAKDLPEQSLLKEMFAAAKAPETSAADIFKKLDVKKMKETLKAQPIPFDLEQKEKKEEKPAAVQPGIPVRMTPNIPKGGSKALIFMKFRSREHVEAFISYLMQDSKWPRSELDKHFQFARGDDTKTTILFEATYGSSGKMHEWKLNIPNVDEKILQNWEKFIGGAVLSGQAQQDGKAPIFEKEFKVPETSAQAHPPRGPGR